MSLESCNKERAAYNLRPLTKAEWIAHCRGWTLHEAKPTNRGLTAYTFKEVPTGGWLKTILAESELEAAKALPQRWK